MNDLLGPFTAFNTQYFPAIGQQHGLVLTVHTQSDLICPSDTFANKRGYAWQVKEAAMELGYQPDETFCLKISQLREIFEVRWSVFLLGPAGCGKTAIWRTLMKAQNNMGEKTVRGCSVLKPRAWLD